MAETKQPYRWYGTKSVNSTLPKMLSNVLFKRGFTRPELILEWPRVVGVMLAKKSVPQKLVTPPGRKDGGTLHIATTDAYSLELQHQQPLIIERINTFFGFAAVTSLRITRLPPKEILALQKIWDPVK